MKTLSNNHRMFAFFVNANIKCKCKGLFGLMKMYYVCIESLGEDPSVVQESCSLSPNGSFIPPLPTTIKVYTNSWQGGEVSNSAVEEVEKKPLVENIRSVGGTRGGNRKTTGQKANNPRRQMGGRKPNSRSNGSKSHNYEDQEKRKIRRERNKMAAARCRKRRVDQTNTLLEVIF